jgi:DNA-binding response OmpR family regulator
VKPGTTERILVIHPDAATGQQIAQAFEKAGYQVEVATDGLDGLVAARKMKPDAVLCDGAAPRLGAIDFCRTVRHEPGLEATYVIALGTGLLADIATTLDAGADAVHAGPLDDATLLARVRAGLRGRGATRSGAHAKHREDVRDRAAAFATDVNNALMALVGHLALARQYLDREEIQRAHSHVDDARRAAERIADATQGFLVACERDR